MVLTQKTGDRKRNMQQQRQVVNCIGVSDMRGAIAALLFEDPAHLDIRHLWTRGRTSFFRVNWWTAVGTGVSRVSRSCFIPLEAVGGGWRIRNGDGDRCAAPPLAASGTRRECIL